MTAASRGAMVGMRRREMADAADGIVRSLHGGAAQGGPRPSRATAGARHARPDVLWAAPQRRVRRRAAETAGEGRPEGADRQIGQTPVGGGLCDDAP